MKATEIRKVWGSCNSSERATWLSLAARNKRFFLNNQLTTAERNSLAEAGMPDFVINKITPAVEMIKYFTTAKHPRWRAVGRTEDDTAVAKVHETLSEYVWDLSRGQALYGRVIESALNAGVGYFHWTVDKDADNGLGEVMLEDTSPEDVFVDQKSRDFLLRDASFIGIRKVMPRGHLMREMPAHKAAIKKAIQVSGALIDASTGNAYDVKEEITGEDIYNTVNKEGDEDEFVEYFRVYTKEKMPYVNVFHYQELSEEQKKEMARQVEEHLEDVKEEMQVAIKEKETELQQLVEQQKIIPERAELEMKKMQEAQESQLQQMAAQLQSQLREQFSKVINLILPKDEWAEVYDANPNKWRQLIKQVVPFNKIRIKVNISIGDTDIEEYLYDEKLTDYPIIPVYYIHTGCPYPMPFTSMLIGKQREINKGHQIVLHNANIGSALRFTYEEGSIDEDYWENYSSSAGALLPYRKGFEKPSPLLPAPFNNAFITLVQESKADMDEITGMYAAGRGGSQGTHSTHSGMLAQDEFGTRRVKQWMINMIDPALEQVGVVFKQLSQMIYTTHKIFRIVNRNNGIIEQHELNKKTYASDGTLASVAMRYDIAQFDVKYIANSTLPVNRWAEIDEYFKWYQSGVIDDIAFIQKSEIANKDDLIQRHSLYSKLQGQLQNMEAEMKKIKGANETLEGQIIQAGIRDKITQGSMADIKRNLEAEAQHKLMNAEKKLNVKAEKAEGQRQLAHGVKSMNQTIKEEKFKQVQKKENSNG